MTVTIHTAAPEHRRIDPFAEARRALLRGCTDAEFAAHVVFLAMPRSGTADLFTASPHGGLIPAGQPEPSGLVARPTFLGA